MREDRPEPREAFLSDVCRIVRSIRHSDLGGWQIQSGAMPGVRLPRAGPAQIALVEASLRPAQSTATGLDSGGTDADVLRTVTCGDGRGWTCCRQMACKRSAVRARLAPLVRSVIRTNRTASTAGKYSNGGRVGRRTCVRIGHLPRLGLLAGHRVPGAEPALASLSPGQIPVSSVP